MIRASRPWFAHLLKAAVVLWVAADSCLLVAEAAGPQAPAAAAARGATVGKPASVRAATADTSASAPDPALAAPLAIDGADITLVKKWGIRVESMRLTAAGYMLDFRYQVVDARKARPLFDRKTKPLLRDEATGAEMQVPVPPKTGALRNSNAPQAGRSYFMFFANPGRFIKAGRRVTVTIGAFKVSGIRVDADAAVPLVPSNPALAGRVLSDPVAKGVAAP